MTVKFEVEDLGPVFRWEKDGAVCEVLMKKGVQHYVASIGPAVRGGYFCHIVGIDMEYFDSLEAAREHAMERCF